MGASILRRIPVTLAALLVVMPGCTAGRLAGPRAVPAPERAPDFFATAVDFFVRPDRPLLLDPRPLRPDALLYSVTESDFVPDKRTVQLRTRVAEAGLRLRAAVVRHQAGSSQCS